MEKVRALAPDFVFSFYYRHLLPDSILEIPRAGAFNLHGSLLPAYRGCAPVNWVLVKGETQTGVTLHHMIARPDAGDVVSQRAVAIDRADTARTLYEKLFPAAREVLDEALPLLREGRAPRIPQDETRASTFQRRTPADGRIDWRRPAETIYNLVRAVTDPYPGAFATLPDGRTLTIWWALPVESARDSSDPGTVEIDGGRVLVTTGDGRLAIERAQIETDRVDGPELAAHFKRADYRVLS